ncbi:MAG: hypothetical protein L0229_27945 [Blastocatellia bacterium]|nr:hypothetical protein [Blastocatellia bacterium]
MKKEQIKKTSTKRVPRQPKPAPDVDKATQQYKEENEDILFAVEAMRRARLAQESRVKHLLDRMGYHVIATK